MSERGKFNNLIITISIFLNIILTVMLIILVGQKTDQKNAGAEAEITGESSQSEFEFVQNGDQIYVLNTDEFGAVNDGGETLPTGEPPTESTTTTTASTTQTTTVTSSTASTTVTTITLATIPTQSAEDDEDSGEWLDMW